MIATAFYDWLMFLHIAAAMIWVGGALAVSLLAGRTLASSNPEAVGEFIRSLRVIGPLLFAPAMAGVLAFGIWMVVDSSEWTVDQTWLKVAIALFAAAVLIGTVFQGRSAIGAQRASEAGQTATARRLLRRWVWGMRLIFLLLILITWDMAAKPWL